MWSPRCHKRFPPGAVRLPAQAGPVPLASNRQAAQRLQGILLGGHYSRWCQQRLVMRVNTVVTQGHELAAFRSAARLHQDVAIEQLSAAKLF